MSSNIRRVYVNTHIFLLCEKGNFTVALFFVDNTKYLYNLPCKKGKSMSKEYELGWRYIVWISGVDDYYVNYKDAKRDADEWKAKGYDNVIIEKIRKEKIL